MPTASIMTTMARERPWERLRRQRAKDKGRIAYIGVTREDKAVGTAREEGFRAGLKARAQN